MNSNIDVQALIASITTEVTSQVLAALDLTVETPASAPTQCLPSCEAGNSCYVCNGRTVTAPAKDSYRVRTDRQKDASHAKIAKVNARWGMRLAGIKDGRKVSDLTADERKAYDAEIRACWTKPAGRKVSKSA